jgi:hypothetical protein
MDADIENSGGLTQAIQRLSLELDRARALRAELAALIQWHHWIGSSSWGRRALTQTAPFIPLIPPRYSKLRQMR